MMRIVSLVVLLLFCAVVKGQGRLVPLLLQVAQNKTTNLIFPAAIQSVDRGNEKIIVQKANNNVLRLKADTLFTDTTNLTIITSDGKLYSFLVSYHASPVQLTFDFGSGERVDRDTALTNASRSVVKIKNYLHGIGFVSGKVRLGLGGIFTDGSMLFCKLRVANESSISFEAGRVRVFTTGMQKTKRRPVQDRETEILLVHEECPVIKNKQTCVLVVVTSKTALAQGQALRIELQEKGGDRHLAITIPNKFIINAKLIQ
jgi:conjugative transposon TraN protein